METRILGSGDEKRLREALSALDQDQMDDSRLADCLGDPNMVCILASDDRRAAGLLYGYVLRRFSKTTFFIYSIDVVTAFRRRGIGKAMIERLSQEALTRGWDELFVLTNAGNAAAMALYESCGGIRVNDDDVMFDFYPAR